MIRCHGSDLIYDVVLYDGWDIYLTLHGHIDDLSGTLRSVGVSDNDTIRVHCRLRGGSNNTDIPGQWQCGNCAATRCWPRPDSPPTPAPWNAGKIKVGIKARSNVPPTAREPQVMPLRGPPGAGVGTSPDATGSPVAPGDLLEALELLQAVMSAEDFSKYEKMVLPPSKGGKDQGERAVPLGKTNLKKDCASKRLVMLTRLLSLKLMHQSNKPCFKVCENSLRLGTTKSVLCGLWFCV